MTELLELARAVVARAVGDEEFEVFVASGTETDVRAYQGEVESYTSASSAGIGVRVLLDGPGGARVGFSSAGSLEPDVVDAVVADARDNARFATPDEAMGFARPDGVEPVTLTLEDPAVAAFTSEQRIALAIELERAARGRDGRVRQVDDASYGDVAFRSALAATSGIERTSSRSMSWLTASVIASANDRDQTGYASRAARGPEGLDLDAVATEAVQHATRMLGATKPDSTRCPVVLDRRVAAALLSVISSALSGETVTKGRSFLADRMGEQVAAPFVTLVDDPTDPRHLAASRTDGEGLACRRNLLIDHGVLCGFVYDTVAARRAGAASTGSALRGGYGGTPTAGCRALQLEPGELDDEGLCKLVGEGIFVQNVTGIHSGVNPIAGDVSVGAEGFRIEGGAVGAPLREMTVGTTLQRLLLDLVAISSQVEWLPGVAAGQALALGEAAISGN